MYYIKYSFADDCVLYREISDPNDVTILQHDLNSVSNWCKTRLMELNTTKCKVLRVSRTSSFFTTSLLENSASEPVTCYRYLGIHIPNTSPGLFILTKSKRTFRGMKGGISWCLHYLEIRILSINTLEG